MFPTYYYVMWTRDARVLVMVKHAFNISPSSKML